MKNMSKEELDRLINVVDVGKPDDKDFYETDADDMLGREYPGVSEEKEEK
jgi:hypothetical protein